MSKKKIHDKYEILQDKCVALIEIEMNNILINYSGFLPDVDGILADFCDSIMIKIMSNHLLETTVTFSTADRYDNVKFILSQIRNRSFKEIMENYIVDGENVPE